MVSLTQIIKEGNRTLSNSTLAFYKGGKRDPNGSHKAIACVLQSFPNLCRALGHRTLLKTGQKDAESWRDPDRAPGIGVRWGTRGADRGAAYPRGAWLMC